MKHTSLTTLSLLTSLALGFLACSSSSKDETDLGDTSNSKGDGDNSGDGGGDNPGGGGGDNSGDSDVPPALSESCAVFPGDNAWNRDISDLPVHKNSNNFVNYIGADKKMHPDFGTEWDGVPIGIPYVLVGKATPNTDITYTAYGDESDPGPFPMPLDAPIEGGPDADGDRHVIAVDTDSCKLYELYRGFPVGDHFEADSGVSWDLRANDAHPQGCTSADAAGLPIFPGLVRYDEVVELKEIKHALRFTVSESQRAYIAPATHYASSNTDADAAPMGLRFRMKASYDCAGYSDETQVICVALKKYGMIVADNGSDWYLSGAPDARWNDDNLGDIKSIPGSAFEVVDSGDAIVTDSPDCEL